MRIAFVNHSRRKVGGAEVYLDSVIPAFARTGHAVAFLCESEADARDAISIPPDAPQWCVSSLGESKALSQLEAWRPDVVFVHGLTDPDLEEAIVKRHRSVLYVHNYYGMCISGNKTLLNGSPKVCERRFGAACLCHYFPDRCGGGNPITMLRLYGLQSRRLQLMNRYSGLIANSEYIGRELQRHGLRFECVTPFTSGASTQMTGTVPDFEPLRLIFVGRFTSLKGGQYLIEALPEVQRRLGKRIFATFAGDGPEAETWKRAASAIRSDATEIEFTGWLTAAALRQRIANSHLLVMPSIWPEPFGLSGLEAGLLGVPSVAFAVGGIPEWLLEGTNGHLAPTPPSSSGLAEVIMRAVAVPQHYAELRNGARAQAHRYELHEHIARLTRIFDRVAR